MSKSYGYVRVSSKDQKETRQLQDMKKLNIPSDNIYVDKESGKNFVRTNYIKMVKRLRQNDVLYIKSIDRLGRNYRQIIEQWSYLTKTKKVDIVVIDMPLLDTRTDKNLIGLFISDIVLQILSFVSENERTNIRKRQKEGIVIAKSNGVKFGRPEKPLPNNFEKVCKDYMNKKYNMKQASKLCKMPLSTFSIKYKKYVQNM